ncbi:serine/threonine-protein kinase [Acrocarpospora sp. B8E8]|uniref:serine/threonine-protein kinase n=1 Tax=Acrocarpospora sp. B8E8 TaxID=3153572 RepID=UPI00325C5344
MIVPLGPGDPKQIGPFTISGQLGEGGQGIVYLGENQAGERAAIKLLHVKFTGDAIARSRFARELRAAQRVASERTARVIAADLQGDTPYIASEYIEGQSLRHAVEGSGPLRGAELDRLAVGTATALTAIHNAGIVHRDFKPDNVLLAADGPRVVDFGIARIIDSTGTITSRAVGTPAYMAPEQISGDDIGPATDVFAWGATMAYAATGQVAFGGSSIAVVLNRILNHDIDVTPLPEPLRGVVRACLNKTAADRPTADQILARLLGRAGEGVPATIVLPPKRKRRRWLPAGLAVGSSMLVIGGVVAGAVLMPFDVTPTPTPTLTPTTPRPTAFTSVFDKAAATGKLIIGVRNDVPGLAFAEPGTASSGFEVEVARYIADKLGVPASGVSFQTVTRFTRVDALKLGQVDLVLATYSYDDFKTDEVTFAGPYYQAKTDVLVRQDAKITTEAQLTGKRLCARPNSTSADQVLARVKMTPVVAANYGDCMNLLKGGLVDAIPGDDLILAGFANREKTLKFRVLGLGLDGIRYAVALPKGDKRTCEPVRQAILDMYETGAARTLLKRFFGRVAFTPETDTPERVAC